MAVPRKGWRTLVVDQRTCFWRASGADEGIEVVVVTEAAFNRGAAAQRLAFRLDYDHLTTPQAGGFVSWKQRAAIAPGVVTLAIKRAVASTPSFTGEIGKHDIALPMQTINELQETARVEPRTL